MAPLADVPHVIKASAVGAPRRACNIPFRAITIPAIVPLSFFRTRPWVAVQCALLVAVGAACEKPTAPTAYVYADRVVSIPVTATGWRAITVGGSHTCAIRLLGELRCWGANGSGQLGVGVARGRCGTTRPAPCEAIPTAVQSSARFAAVSAGSRHTCAITTTGALFCWGENLMFQTASQGDAFVRTPRAVRPDLQFTDVAAGASHTCAVRTNGVVYCWGEGRLGALGRGDTLSSVLPEPILSTERFTTVRTGLWNSCAIALDGVAWCWGSEWESAEGFFDFFHERKTPHRVDALPLVRDISASSSSMCAISLDGVAFCWQGNAFAQLGRGDTKGIETPLPVATDEVFASVSAGIIQTCGLATDGRALCWGNDSFGQLGVPRTGERCGISALECSSRPIEVFGRLRFVSVVTGLGNHTCGISVSSAAICWGLGNNGQLGDGYTRDRQSIPVGVLPEMP